MVDSPQNSEPSGVIPNDPNPDSGKGIPFSVDWGSTYATWGGGDDITITEFSPVYYPDRYTDTLNRDVDRSGRQCGGEDVSVEQTKNPEFHATGIVLDANVSNFREMRQVEGPVDLITPLTDNDGGMEVIITKAKIGEIVGWDGVYKQWQFSYTLDMIATGGDTNENDGNQVVSELLEDAD